MLNGATLEAPRPDFMLHIHKNLKCAFAQAESQNEYALCLRFCAASGTYLDSTINGADVCADCAGGYWSDDGAAIW